jgi:hypothetical protein
MLRSYLWKCRFDREFWSAFNESQLCFSPLQLCPSLEKHRLFWREHGLRLYKTPAEAVFLMFNSYASEIHRECQLSLEDIHRDGDDVLDLETNINRELEELADTLDRVAWRLSRRTKYPLKLSSPWDRFLELHIERQRQVHDEKYERAQAAAAEFLTSIKRRLNRLVADLWTKLLAGDEAPVSARIVWQAISDKRSIDAVVHFTRMDAFVVKAWIAAFLDHDLLSVDLQDEELVFKNRANVYRGHPKWAETISKLNKWPSLTERVGTGTECTHRA